MSWINGEKFDFNNMLLTERFQIRQMFRASENEEWFRNIGIALNSNPAVKWYFLHKCPERAEFIEKVTADYAEEVSPEEVRKAEIFVLEDCCDFVVYANPEIMDSTLSWIYEWDKSRLLELVDFTDKTVLDIGSGSGRLAFAAAEKAAWVYASEPVDTLREYMRDKIKRENIKNMRVVDGIVTELPYPDNTFDIVMAAHVIGDEWDAEIAEITRVCKSGGWHLDLSGAESEGCRKVGFEEIYDTSCWDNYRYRKQIFK